MGEITSFADLPFQNIAMQLFFQEDISASTNKFELSPEESNHLLRVLRRAKGDMVYVTNGKGLLLTCRIDETNNKTAVLSVMEHKTYARAPFHIHLAIAPVKNQDRMEWMLEKISEIGIQEITLLNTHYTEKTFLKMNRLEKKIVSACKQSLNTWKPRLNVIREFDDFVRDNEYDGLEKFIAYLDKGEQKHLFQLAKPSGSYLVLIGPEGDFSTQEIQLSLTQKFKPCSLGASRLRTETAGLVAVHTLNLIQTLH